MTQQPPEFPADLTREFSFGDMGNGLFGLDALRNLTTGMDEFLEDPNGRWRQYRSLGPAVLGCVPWFDDEQLLGRVDRFASSCIVSIHVVRMV